MSVPPEHVYSRWLDGPQSPPDGQLSFFNDVWLQPAYGSALPGEHHGSAEAGQSGQKEFMLQAGVGDAALQAANQPVEEMPSRVTPPAEPISALWARKTEPTSN